MKILMDLMDIAINEAKKGLALEEVPIGCAVMYKGKCIDSSHNLTNKNRDPLAHAEMLCLKRLPAELVPEIVLYVTCEPCIMCLALMVKIGVKEVVYGCINPRFGGFSPFIAEGILEIVDYHPAQNRKQKLSKHDQDIKNIKNKNNQDSKNNRYLSDRPDSTIEELYKMHPHNIIRSKYQDKYIDMQYIPDDRSVHLLKAFYLLENTRAPVEKRKIKSTRQVKNFKNETE